ncbi:1745_t:CDS:1, partial [Racocetra persica]
EENLRVCEKKADLSQFMRTPIKLRSKPNSKNSEFSNLHPLFPQLRIKKYKFK